MNIRDLAHTLGGEVVGRFQVLCPGPNHSRQDRSLSIRLNPNSPDGFIVHSHAGDDWRTCRDYVRQRLGLAPWQPGQDDRDRTIHPHKRGAWDATTREREAQEERPMTEDELERIAGAVELWNESQDPRGTLAEKYLQEQRKLDLPDDIAGTALRFNPRTPWRDENIGKTIYIPALIAAFRNVTDDSITAVHRIGLTKDGEKIGRRMMGVVRGAAVKLKQPRNGELVVAEGIETALAAMAFEIGPAWALGSVEAIKFFAVQPGIRHLILAEEAGEPSRTAVKICSRRWRRAGRKTNIVSSEFGSDLNDAVINMANEAARK
jgi:putative DNA primase/helicase